MPAAPSAITPFHMVNHLGLGSSSRGAASRHHHPRLCLLPLPDALADGVTKRMTRPPLAGSEPPPYGALVHVTYTVAYQNGTVFDATHETTPFTFQLNTNRAIEGLELGISTMAIGERATIECAPEYAYGAAGAGSVVPPNTPITYEVELVDWEDGPPVESGALDMRAYKTALEGDAVSEGEAVGYRWREGGEEIELRVALGDDQRAADVLECEFGRRSLRLRLADAGASPGVELEGELRGKIRIDECYWVLDDDDGARELVVTLVKDALYTKWGAVFREPAGVA